MEDTFYPFLNIYRRFPSWMQTAIGFSYRALPKGFRLGPFYDAYNRRINHFIYLTKSAELSALQLDLLKETVNRAVANVPFYRQFNKMKEFNDIYDYPVISKSDIVGNLDGFMSKELNGSRLKSNTGGSSGTPMTFFLHSGRTRPKEQAHFDWFWGQYGFVQGSRVLMIRGAPLKNNALYEFQAIKNCLAVSCYELNSDNVSEAVQEARRFHPQFIHGYPSAVKNFMNCIDENERLAWDIPIKALFVGSEWLSEDDRLAMETFFNSKVVTWYGHSECAIMGGNSLDSNEFFFYPFYGYAELLDDNGKPVKTPGQVGRIIATSFDNFVMPFIRYDTGDLGVLSHKSTLGNMPCLVLKKIEGRTQDFIYLQDNTRVSLTAFIFGQHLPQFSKIREMQLEQHMAGHLILRIVRGRGYDANDERDILNRLCRSVSEKINIEFNYVNSIEKTYRGKHRFLIQKIGDQKNESTNPKT